MQYEHLDAISVITMDDGKANAMSPAMQAELHEALDQAEADGTAVVLTGRAGLFSAGFDLKIIAAGGVDAAEMIDGGFQLAQRLLSFSAPVVTACSGHAVAMGVFVLLCGDHCVGVDGPYRIVANEVSIGMTMPWTATEILRHRLTPAAFHRAATLSEVFSPERAVVAGFLDEIVEPELLRETAIGVAGRLAALDRRAFAATKLRSRVHVLRAVGEGIKADASQFPRL